MSLLFDQNLSHRLTRLLAAEFPGSQHVRDVGLAASADEDIWEFAKLHRLMVVSKDSDFLYRSLVYGHPPKVIWLRIGNNPTSAVVTLLRARAADILAFASDLTATILVLP
ncbi:MAG: DUF5615 family PIN-like protein [Planctomycetaceae bacterium]|nr:DUF5615 family PIN-like protein [Planctomycetaceae bacterium]